jgi:purine nucleoside phosphorylase
MTEAQRYLSELQAAADYIKSRMKETPRALLILGSGLDDSPFQRFPAMQENWF